MLRNQNNRKINLGHLNAMNYLTFKITRTIVCSVLTKGNWMLIYL